MKLGVVKRLWRRRALRYSFCVILLATAYFTTLPVTGNFHEVVEGELYRSAQLSGDSLTNYAQKYQIRSIINLRGENIGSDWYDEEVTAAKANNIQLLNFRMSSKHALNQAQALQLIALMEDAPKPLLIHCQAGADRSGLAAALYVAAISKGGESAAEFQLSPFFGHLPYRLIGAPAMNQTFELMEPSLGFLNS